MIGVVIAMGSAMSVPGCHSLLRYRASAENSVTYPETIAARLNGSVLTALTSTRLVVEVDWIDKCAPSDDALRALERSLREVCIPGRNIVVSVGEIIPAREWIGDTQYDSVRRLVDRHLTADPFGDDEVVYVLYVPTFGDSYVGFASEWPVKRSDRVGFVSGCVICSETVRRRALLWITPATVERSTLIHEFGHVLGLVTNPAHAKATDSLHCANTECVMSRPTPRVIAANFFRGLFTGRLPSVYCDACRTDIRLSQEYWKVQALKDPRYGDRLRGGRGRSPRPDSRGTGLLPHDVP